VLFLLLLSNFLFVNAQGQNDIINSNSGIAYSQNQTFVSNNMSILNNISSSISIPSTLTQILKDHINFSLTKALIIAEAYIGNNSLAIQGLTTSENGFLLHIVFVLDTNNDVYRVFVDPGNGQVLSSQKIPNFDKTPFNSPLPGIETEQFK
jgi:hypothetical protein